MPEGDAQKKEIEQAGEPLQDLTPEKDATGGSLQNADPDAQKKEIEDI